LEVTTAVNHLADEPSSFWPTGAVMIVVILVTTAAVHRWRSRNTKKGKGGPGK
jgi:hypothetical protein